MIMKKFVQDESVRQCLLLQKKKKKKKFINKTYKSETRFSYCMNLSYESLITELIPIS